MVELEQQLPSAKNAIPSLRSNFAWTFVGNICYGACQWGILSAIAKLGSTSIVGEFTLGLAVSAPVFTFTMLQLRYIQATDMRAESGFADYFSLRLLTTSLGLMAILAMLLFSGDSAEVSLVIFLVSIAKSIECMSDVTAGLLQREEQLRRVAISLMLRGIGSLVVFLFTFAYSRSLASSVAAMCGVWLAVFLFYDVSNVKILIGRHGSFFRFEVRELWRLILLGLPLGWVATFGMLLMSIPRFFLQHYLGLADQGVYASLSYLVVAINLVVLALTQSVTTRMALLFANGDLKQFVRLLTRLSMLGVSIGAFGVPVTFLVGRRLVTLLYRREYADQISLLALFVAIAGLATIVAFLFCGLTAARKFRVQVPVYLTALIIEVVASMLLVPQYGLMGAGIAQLLSMSALVAGGLWVIYKVLRTASP